MAEKKYKSHAEKAASASRSQKKMNTNSAKADNKQPQKKSEPKKSAKK